MKRMFRTIAMAAIASLAITGCVKHSPLNPRPDEGHGGNNGGGKTEEKLVVTERSDWTVSYKGRVQDGESMSEFEKFKFSYSGSGYVIPLIISPDDLKNVYENDLVKFFSYEAKLLQQDVNANPDTPLSDMGVFSSKSSETYFNRHIHGTWILYLVELDAKLNLTGQYAEYTFTIEEEEATEAFKRWYGTYHVSDGYGAFDIVVSDADANYLYYVDGWETGRSVSQQMDGERDWIYARFDNGRMVFYAQFLTTEDYDGTTVDEVFAGTYLTPSSDSIGDLDWEGVDYEDNLAYTVQEGEKLILNPWTIELDNGYSFTYASMRYSRLWFTDNGNTVNWAFYNTAGVPMLPAEMTPIPGTRSSVSAPAVRLRSKGTVHRDQLKPVRSTRQRRDVKN